jgi:YidC/Oxa1 family membrane protein insertase
MDRNTTIGFVLIALVLVLWMWLNAPQPGTHQSPPADTAQTHRPAAQPAKIAEAPATPSSHVDSLGKFFSTLSRGVEKEWNVETDRFTATLSSRGAGIRKWELKNFKTWDHQPVNLINSDTRGEFNLLFYSADGKLINTSGLFFTPVHALPQTTRLEGSDSLRIDMQMVVAPGSRIVKSLIFYAGKSSFDAEYRFEGMQNIIANFEYQVTWENGLRYPERNSIDECNSANASAYSGGELTEIDASSLDARAQQTISGRVTWIATRIKYFAVAIIPREKESSGAYLEGVRHPKPDQGAKEDYSIALKMPFLGKQVETDRFTVYLGPLEYSTIKSFDLGLDQVMSLGWAWIIRPISEYVIIPVFQFLHLFIPNYGIVLIVFALLIKVVLHPLTKTSMRSMQKMQQLQPMMNEIREKYKEDPQKMQQQIMRLYKEYGVNPAGGCLPMLLQLPILYALWMVFRSTIELRQAPFVGWINDLSIPDIITTLPFHIPLFGISEVSGLAILVGITMFFQQKMSVKDPRQKMMIWMMPTMMTLLFNSFPSGLNLYYFFFNVLSIAQQAYVNKQHAQDPLRKVEEKKKSSGIIARLSKDMPKLKR